MIASPASCFALFPLRIWLYLKESVKKTEGGCILKKVFKKQKEAVS